MKDLFNRTWFRPALLGLFALLQLALLFTVALLRPDFDAAENAYLQLIAEIENSTESSATSGNMLDICAGWGVPPLYPLLLQAASAALRGTGISIRAIPGLFNLFLFLLTWPALYFCTRQFIRNPWAAPIIPFLYGISAGAAFTVRTAGPYMLTTLLCVVAVQLLAFIQKKPHSKLLHAGLFLVILSGFLTLYAFAAFTLALVLPYAVYCIIRRRYSDMATTVVTSAAALLTGTILYPACIEQLAASSLPFTSGYAVRLSALFSRISTDLFGGLLIPVLVVLILLILAARFFRDAVPKPAAELAPAASEPVPAAAATLETSVPTGRDDPAEAAYLRRIARRTRAISIGKRRPVLSEETCIFLMITATVLLSFLLFPTIHAIFPGSLLRENAGQVTPQLELSYLLYPLLILIFASLLYRCVPAIGGNRFAAVILTSGFFIALSIISFARSGLLTQNLTFFLFAG